MKVVKQNKARVLQQRGEQWSKFMRESNLTICGRCHLFTVMDEQGTLFNEFWLMCENPQVNPAPGRNVLKPLHSPRGLPKWSFWCLHVPCWKSQQKNTDVGLSARGTPLPKHEHLGSDCKMWDSTHFALTHCISKSTVACNSCTDYQLYWVAKYIKTVKWLIDAWSSKGERVGNEK